MKLPKLFKKTSTGKIQTWEVWTEGAVMHSQSGQLDGKLIKSSDTISEGKNIGKANETSKEKQAELEAESRWRSKKKKGYVEQLVDAEEDKTSDLVEGGYLPTLAKVYEKAKQHVVFPCAAQPKLDGNRATYAGGEDMWSRTRKKIVSVPHIPRFLNTHSDFRKLDGELYNHALRDDFETLSHIVNQKKTPAKNHEIMEYHVYDIPSDKPFRERMVDLEHLQQAMWETEGCPIVVVETVICKDEKELMEYREKCLEAGYEGAMVRNLDAPYEYKRSKHLQKLKIMEDAEFVITGVEEGRGKLSGHAGSFLCTTPNGDIFKAKLKGSLSNLKEYWINSTPYIGKTLTVQFQGYTNKNNVPRFPVALRFREE